MKADPRFSSQSKEFWAYVRLVSQEVGYTLRGTGKILVPQAAELHAALTGLQLSTAQLFKPGGVPSNLATALLEYFAFRAQVLNQQVRLQLMDRKQAGALFRRLKRELKPQCPLPMNKQKGEKRNHAFLTGIVNMLIEQAIGGLPCDYDPRGLTVLTQDQQPLRTLARRVDGAFPAVINPIAIWEIKEYYYTTTFGSRVADGVYETLLDGMELEELCGRTGRKVQHVLMVDDRFTWWDCGKSYLCRIVDMLHMGYVDEVLFGREVLSRLPVLAAGWKAELAQPRAG